MRWDLFGRVIDNLGDVGVCWRLAADLGARGETVRLWLDDAAALAWMAPRGAPGVEVRAWPVGDADFLTPGDVVVEAFGCALPDRVVGAMAQAARAPRWVNLEYLSAESYVERSHRLVSPVLSGPGAGLRKHFYYPGFSPGTGGLLREPDLIQRRAGFDARGWWAAQGLAPRPGERIVSLFCYAAPALPALIEQLSTTPTLLLATAGHAARQVEALLGAGMARGALRAAALPWLTQRDYDHLLWAADLNLVRGEDSFVRAQWADRPFVWQIYAQDDGVHRVKLDAFLDRFDAAAPVRAWWQAWNAGRPDLPDLPALDSWGVACRNWRSRLLAQRDLTTQLLDFVADSG